MDSKYIVATIDAIVKLSVGARPGHIYNHPTPTESQTIGSIPGRSGMVRTTKRKTKSVRGAVDVSIIITVLLVLIVFRF